MILSKLFGTKSEREIKKLSTEVDKINHSYKSFSGKSDEELINRTKELRNFIISTRDEKIESVKDIAEKKIRDEKILICTRVSANGPPLVALAYGRRNYRLKWESRFQPYALSIDAIYR